MKLNNKAYDILKWIVITVCPALILLLGTLLPLYEVPAETVNVITATISAVTTFIGTMIGISSINYGKENKE